MANSSPQLLAIARPYLIVLISGAAAFLGIKFVVPLLTPFLVGLLIASLIEPLVRFCGSRLRIRRPWAVLLCLLLCVIIMSIGLVIGVGKIVSELDQLTKRLPEYQAQLSQWSEKPIKLLGKYYENLPQPVIKALEGSQNSIYTNALKVGNSILIGIRSIPNLFVTLLVAFLTAYFISRDRDDIVKASIRLTPPRWRKKIVGVRTDMVKSIVSYIRAQVILMCITSVVVIIAIAALGVRYSWLIGIAAGILDILPMVGPAAIFVPWMLIMLLTGNAAFALKLGVILGLTMGIRQIFEAKVVGESIGVHPLVTLLSLYVFVQLFGLSGFILGPFVVIIVKALMNAGVFHFYPVE